MSRGRRNENNSSSGVKLPDAATAAGPTRRRRKSRRVDRVRVGLVLGALGVVAIGFFALPVANDIRANTIDFLIPGEQGEIEFEEGLVGPFAAPSEKVPEPEIDFDTSVFVDPRMVSIAPPQGFDGLLTFRGSPTRTYYGRGPVPENPAVQWRFPESGGLCRSLSLIHI